MTKILLVEDDKSLREIYGVRLLAEGYDIISAGDGEEALAMAIKDRPSLIVSDVMMPKISGFDMLDILRSTTETKDIKVIMMTALSSDDQRQRGVALGADRYLVKSQVGIEDVVRTVHEVLGDAPVAGGAPASATPQQPAPAPQQTFAAPVSNPTPVPTPMEVSQPAAAPQSAPAPNVTPSQAPVAPQTPTESSLPQPTAPFSTPRPANLGDRVIQPLVKDAPAKDFSGMIDLELSGTPAPSPASATPSPMPAMEAPTAPPVTPPLSAQPVSSSPSPQPQINGPINGPVSTGSPASSLPPVPPAPQPPTAGLNFEETPRPSDSV